VKISSIVAISNNYAIGIDNDLPWHMPADLQFFKQTTQGHHVLMGRKSFDSIGKPLPGRTNIIITRNKAFQHSGIHIFHSISSGLLFAQEAGINELFILGGSNIYFQTLGICTDLYVTRIDTHIPNATAFFPKFDGQKWTLISQEDHNADEKNPHDYSFCHYQKS